MCQILGWSDITMIKSTAFTFYIHEYISWHVSSIKTPGIFSH